MLDVARWSFLMFSQPFALPNVHSVTNRHPKSLLRYPDLAVACHLIEAGRAAQGYIRRQRLVDRYFFKRALNNTAGASTWHQYEARDN